MSKLKVDCIAVFDYETDGRKRGVNRPIEFGGIKVLPNGEIEELNMLINWAGRDQNNITRTWIDKDTGKENSIELLTGITNEMIETEGINDDSAVLNINNFLFVDNAPDLIIGHNAISFDFPFLDIELENKGYAITPQDKMYDTAGEFKAEQIGFEQDNKSLYDFHRTARYKRAKGVKFNLQLAIEYYGIPSIGGDFHRAMTDVYYTFGVFCKQLKKRMDVPDNILIAYESIFKEEL